MKKIINILLAIAFINILNAHEQYYAPVHQRIVYEAYKLLKIQLSKEANGIADIDQYIGEVKYYNANIWHDIKTITGGSSHEDDEDIVYGYYGFKLPWSSPTHTSITHFWKPDKPFDEVYLHSWGYFPSAYQKAIHYINDDYPKLFKYPFYRNGVFGIDQLISDYSKKASNEKNHLYNWYWQDKIWIREYNVLIGGYYPINITFKNFYYNWGNQKSREMFFNLLGRLSHLLADMGVPEHAKKSIHPFEDMAPYEHWLGKRGKTHYENEFYWTAEKVYSERGGFVNPFCEYNDNEIFFLFYTLGQLSDNFANYGETPGSGNINYDTNVGEIESIMKSYAPSDINYYLNRENKYWRLNETSGRAFRDVLLPYTIRAVAGLLYKYIIEAKMQFPNATEDDKGSIYDQQQELDLFNQDINGDYYTFRAEGNPGRITVASDNRPANYPADFVIGSDTKNVTFRASKIIIFKPGFVAKEGSDVRAYIVPNCSKTNQSGNCQQCLDEDFNPQYDRSN